MRPIAGATPTNLWRPAMAKIQIGAPPLYHRHNDWLGTTLSFHLTTKHAWYKERGPAHGFGFGVARPANDLLGDMTSSFSVASSASVRTRQAEQAHARAQPMSKGAVARWQRQTTCNASDATRWRAAAPGRHSGKGQSSQAWPGPARMRAVCQSTTAGDPNRQCRANAWVYTCGHDGGQCGSAESQAMTAP